jgi:tripartite-type tricarboxylate transporter receptor subunit TctC
MQGHHRTIAIACAAASLAAAHATDASAQSWPARPVRIVVPYPTGGGSDNLARLYAPKLAEALGQQVLVDNRPGGSARIGTEIVARAVPDGYTILKVDTAFLANPALFAKLPYDTLRDFAPISRVADGRAILVVHPSLPVKTLKEFIAMARARPGQTTYSSPGHGTGGHLTSELFRVSAGLDMVHVPYKGAGPAVTDVVGGQIAITFAGVSTTKGFIDAGRLRPLAVTGDRRVASLPNVPTFSEAGLPAVNTNSSWGLVGPAGLPKDVIDRIQSDVRKAVMQPDLHARLTELGYDPVGSSPADWAETIRERIGTWTKVVRAAGIKIE